MLVAFWVRRQRMRQPSVSIMAMCVDKLLECWTSNAIYHNRRSARPSITKSHLPPRLRLIKQLISIDLSMHASIITSLAICCFRLRAQKSEYENLSRRMKSCGNKMKFSSVALRETTLAQHSLWTMHAETDKTKLNVNIPSRNVYIAKLIVWR